MGAKAPRGSCFVELPPPHPNSHWPPNGDGRPLQKRGPDPDTDTHAVTLTLVQVRQTNAWGGRWGREVWVLVPADPVTQQPKATNQGTDGSGGSGHHL